MVISRYILSKYNNSVLCRLNFNVFLHETEMWLEPKYNNYGLGYSSGRVILGLTRGNYNLVNVTTNAIYDARRLDFGCMVGKAVNHVDSYIVSKIRENGPRWTNDFHIFTTIWNSDGFEFMVDGEQVGKLSPGPNEWMQAENVNKVAPFDQEVYIVSLQK